MSYFVFGAERVTLGVLWSIDLCHAFEYLMFALCKYQKWKEKVKISDLILKTMAFVKFLKTENLTKNIWEFYIGRALMPVHVQPRY